MPEMIAAALLTRDPRRLAALCDLWCAEQCEIWLTLCGRSMEPGMPSGTRIRLRCGGAAPEPGCVVAFRCENRLVVHRLISVSSSADRSEFVCQGDNNEEPDLPVTADRLVGRVVEIRAPTRLQRWRLALREARRRLPRWKEPARGGAR